MCTTAVCVARVVLSVAAIVPAGQATLAQSPIRLTTESTDDGVKLLEFRPIGPIVWVDDESVALIDRDDQNVVIVNLATGAMRTVGRRGQGPGEMSNALLLLASAGRGLLVGDMQLRRVSEFTASGDFVRSQRLPGLPIGLMSWDGDRAVAAWMEIGPTPRAVVGDVDLETGGANSWYSLFEVGLTVPESWFPPPLIALAKNAAGLILAGQGGEYRIIALDAAGNLHRSFGRPELQPQQPSEEQIAAARERAGRLSGGRPPPPELARRMEESMLEQLPFFDPGSFSVDGEGRLWVISSRMTNDSSEVDVFSAEGRMTQALTIRDLVQSIAFRESRIAVLVERQAESVEGFHGVDVYRVGR